jgi:pyruvate dehydrogenase E2 component (dihydrolipoamide acetyltransferase)
VPEGGELMAEEVFIPKLGQTVEEVTLVKWLVEDGAKVEQGQELLEVETDKAIFTVEATAKGYLHRGAQYTEGMVLPVLTIVAIIGKAGDKFGGEAVPSVAAAAAEDTARAAAAPATPAEPGPAPADLTAAGKMFASPRARKLAEEKNIPLAGLTGTGGGGVRVVERDVLAYLAQAPKATPLAQKLAAETGVDLRQIPGTGQRGTITREDVERMAAPAPAPVAPPPAPAAPVTAPAPAPLPGAEVVKRVPLTGVRKIIAERMAASVHTTARVTLMTEVDATEFVAARTRLKAAVEKAWGFAPGYNDLLAKIVAAGLRQFPYMNARITPDAIEHLGHVNMGMAVDTERGLLVPVIRDADRKTLREFGSEFRAMVDRARIGKSLPDDLSGGSFTITNLGMYDVDAFTPVINMPEAAILGVGRIVDKVVPYQGQPAIRPMLTLSLVFDHRLVDGAPAARFLQFVKQVVEEPYLLLTA